MNNSFISRLPAQHAALRYNKAFAIRVLDDDARVVPNLSSLPVAALREFCAAVLWLNASSPVRQTDIEGLSDAERDVLCRMLGISGDGAPLVLSRRIHAVISSAEQTASAHAVSFYSLVHSFHPELDGDTASLKRTAQNSSFASHPATRAEAQEDAAMAVWCEAALLKPDDLQSLPIVLRKRLEKAHNIDSRWPEQVRADAAFNLVKAWRAPASGASQQSAATPPAPQPSPPNPQPPPYTPPGVSAVSAQHLGGGGGPYGTNFFGTGLHGQAASAITAGLQSLSLSAPSPLAAQPNPPVASTSLLPAAGAHTSFDWARAEGQQKLLSLQSLHSPILNLLSDSERKQMLEMTKVSNAFSAFGAAPGAPRTAPVCIYAELPWQQALVLFPGYGAAAQGRQVQIALRCDSPYFGGSGEQLIRTSRMAEELRQVNLFNRAFSARNAPECLLWSESIRRLLIEQARINAITATADASRYPQPEFGLLAQARQAQHEQMPLFLHAVACQIDLQSAGSDSLRSQVGMWKQFIDGWHISAQAGAQRASAMALTAGFSSGGDGGGYSPGPGGHHDSDSDDHAPKSRSAPKDKAAQRQTPKVKAPKDKTLTPNYFPASKEVIGAALGIEPPAARCKFCLETGHFHSDCPVGWAKRGHPLPGFNKNGRKVRSAWDGDNPTKDTFAAWVRLWKDATVFENGPLVRDGSPDLAALRKARRDGAPP